MLDTSWTMWNKVNASLDIFSFHRSTDMRMARVLSASQQADTVVANSFILLSSFVTITTHTFV